jgi:hypothetical protein
MSSFAASDNSVAVAPIQDTDDSQELVQRTQVSNEVADDISQTNPGNSATLSLEDCQRLALVHIGPDSQVSNEGINRVATHYHLSATKIAAKDSTIDDLAEENNKINNRVRELELESATKDETIGSLKEEVKEKDEKLGAVSSEQQTNKEIIAIIEHREGHLRVGEKALDWLCELVVGLELKYSMTLGSLTTALESADSRLNLKHKRPRRIAVRDVSSFLACTYPHKELCPLFIALIDDEHALTYDVLLRLNKLRKKKKEEGDEGVHGSRPAPLILSSEIVPEILKEVFLQDKNHPMFLKLEEWAADYGRKHPNVSPTKKQRCYTKSPARSASAPTTPASMTRKRRRSATPSLLPEASTNAPPDLLNSSLSTPRSTRRRLRY